MSAVTELVGALAREQPLLIRLAEAVSLGARVDPPLLRKARLEFVPEADAGTEAELWRSPLVKVRSPEGFVFLSEAAEALRSRLARDPQRLAACRSMTEALHQHLSPAVQLEEEIAWLSVVKDPEAAGRIEELLRSALAALVVDERRGLASWAARALPSLPSSVRVSPTASMLHAGAQLRLRSSAEPLRGEHEMPEWAPWVAPLDLPRIPVAVRLFPGKVELDASGSGAGARLDLPATDPLLVDLSWDGGGAQVTFRKGEVQRIDVPAQDVRLRTVLGEVYDLRKQGTAPPGIRDWIIDFTEERERHRPYFGRERKLADLESWISHSGAVFTVETGSLRRLSRGILLEGEIGSGKTAFLAAMIDRLEASTGILPPHHFFHRGDARTENLDTAERSLVAQIVARVPGTPASLTHASLSDLLAYLSDQRLLSRPLVIVVDAIDESMDSQGEPGALNHLLQTDIPEGVVVIASARPGSPALRGWDRFPLGPASEALEEYWRGKIEPKLIQRAVAISQGSFHLADVLIAWLQDHHRSGSLADLKGAEELFSRILGEAASLPAPETLTSALRMLIVAREPLPRFVMQRYLWSDGRFFAGVLAPLLRPGTSRNEQVFALRNDTVRQYLMTPRVAERLPEAHRRLAETVAPLSWESASLPDDARVYGLRHGIEHWVLSGAPWATLRLATSASFLSDQILLLGLDAAIRSLRTWSRINPSAQDAEAEIVQEIVRILDAHRPILAKDPSALPSILHTGLKAASLPPESLRDRLDILRDEPPLRLAEPFPEGLVQTLPSRHQGSVIGCTFTPFSPGVLSWSTDGTLRLWERPQELRIFAGHTGEVTGGLVQEDYRVISSSRDCTLRVWDQLLNRTLWGHEGEVLGVLAVDPQCAVSWSSDRTLRIWDLEQGREHLVLRGHEGTVTACALEAGSDLLVSGSEDTTVRVWDLSSGDLLHTLRGHTAPITCLAILDGARIVSGSRDRSLRIWSLEGNEPPQILEGHGLGVLGCAISADGRTLASWSQDRTIRLWPLDLDEGEPVRPLTLTGHEGAVLDCAFYEEGDRLASCSEDRTVRIWNVETGEPLAVLQGHEGPVRALALEIRPTRDRLEMKTVGILEMMTARIASASDDRTLRIWNAQKYDAEAYLDGDDATLLCIPFQDRLRVATVSRQGLIRINHAGNPVPAWIGSPSMPIGGAVLTPSHKKLCLWSKGLIEGRARVAIWDLATGETTRTLTGHKAPILACATSGDTLLTASLDGTLRQWDIRTGALIVVVLEAEEPLCDVQVSRDGLVLAACWDGTLQLWDLRASRNRRDRNLEGHTDRVLACAISGSGIRAVSASADRTLRFWDLVTGSTIRVLTGHTAEVTGCLLLEESRRIISRSKDGTVGIWDMDHGEPIAFTQGHTDWVTAIALDEDLGIIYSCSEDRTVRAWDLATGEARGAVYGTSPFRSLAVVRNGVYAGDEAGNLWKLEYGKTPALREEALGGVLLVHALEDREVARRLQEALEQAGVEVWDSDYHLDEIKKQIEKCSLFVPLLSRSSLQEAWLKWELQVARSRSLPANRPFIVPVLIGDVDVKDIPEDLRNIQALRLPDETKISEVVSAIRDLYRRRMPA